MNINDIITLANAGFSKDDISALLQTQGQTQATNPVQTPVQVPAPVPAPVPAQVPAQVPAPVPAPVPAQVPENDSINKMLAEMTLLRQDIQSNNIVNSQQPKVETADDIIAKIINPPTKE